MESEKLEENNLESRTIEVLKVYGRPVSVAYVANNLEIAGIVRTLFCLDWLYQEKSRIWKLLRVCFSYRRTD